MMRGMKVLLRNPTRTEEVPGPTSIASLLHRFGLHRDAVLIIANNTLVPSDGWLADDDVVEIRPVISGGAW